MTREKKVVFIAVLIGLAALILLSVFMTWPRYQKTVEQVPENIAGSGANEALLQIRSVLDDAEDLAAKTTDSDSGIESRIVWTGTVYASRYQTLSGESSIYYVCPYIVMETAPATKAEENGLNAADDDGSEKQTEENRAATDSWTISLHFAVSGLRDDVLADVGNRIRVQDILFSCRVEDEEEILRAGYGDGELSDVNSTSVNYKFLDRDAVTSETNALAKLEVYVPVGMKPTAVINWSFVISERNHVIGSVDNVQIEIPLADSSSQSETSAGTTAASETSAGTTAASETTAGQGTSGTAAVQGTSGTAAGQ